MVIDHDEYGDHDDYANDDHRMVGMTMHTLNVFEKMENISTPILTE